MKFVLAFICLSSVSAFAELPVAGASGVSPQLERCVGHYMLQGYDRQSAITQCVMLTSQNGSKAPQQQDAQLETNEGQN